MTPARVPQRHQALRQSAARSVVVAVEGVTLSVADGEVVSLIGPSGCGKSTLLNMGSGLDPASSGEVFVDGERVTKPNRHVAFMLQKDLLLPWRTIVENVELGQEIQGLPRRERRQRALDLLAKCRLPDFAHHYPHQLSGGMRQRAALARTLAVDPSVLLMDEPFSALDAQTKMVLQQDLAPHLGRDRQDGAVHHPRSRRGGGAVSDRILVMSQRPGRIIEEITVEIGDRDDPMKRRQASGGRQLRRAADEPAADRSGSGMSTAVSSLGARAP